MSGVAALYLHLPFCLRRCAYCDFASEACGHANPLMGAYEHSLERLVGQAADVGLLGSVETAYLGGGTPTMLGAEALGALVGCVCASGDLAEVSFEANPESLTDEVLAAARAAGATRVSVGVQSFDDTELRALGRVHTAELARERVRAAVDAGLATSLDLMCGIPYQTAASWECSLAAAVGLGVGHVSCYPLMIEPGTRMERLCETGALPWPSDDTEADDMEAAERVLGAAGLRRYEVASYALPGQRCRHNEAYWTGVEYLGLGTAAASMLGRASYEALRRACPFLPAARQGAARLRLTLTSPTRAIAAAAGFAELTFDVEQLSAREAVAEDLMLGLRMTCGVGPDLLGRAREAVGASALDTAVEAATGRGLVRWEDGRLAPTERGWLMGNELYGLFWDLAS
ncbi:coproporphyrinogen-III oxidase family protein [Thermophilibacter immobilis]|uniref:Heme chaperone HemW n=1 Tax=Thermophilibacter immobilis TaxID=2779519 RepID=A0A7S7RVA3_9ACTN|nr:coproporphyrinogen-III oxidase family protein [Thermophilibacter immobilis]QOY61455.1 coproporphyrinogen III oxidase family protein [Thermophilibacter immobilis]